MWRSADDRPFERPESTGAVCFRSRRRRPSRPWDCDVRPLHREVDEEYVEASVDRYYEELGLSADEIAAIRANALEP